MVSAPGGIVLVVVVDGRVAATVVEVGVVVVVVWPAVVSTPAVDVVTAPPLWVHAVTTSAARIARNRIRQNYRGSPPIHSTGRVTVLV